MTALPSWRALESERATKQKPHSGGLPPARRFGTDIRDIALRKPGTGRVRKPVKR